MGGRRITTFARLVRRGGIAHETGSGPLRLGVDLGTANLVCAVVDGTNRPVAGAWRAGRVVRDGVVVDWHGAVGVINELKQGLEAKLTTRFERAAVAIPPGINAGTIKVFSNVLQACGLACDEVVDEPVAAATALGVTDGVVIDVGGGTTGVSLLRDGRTEFSLDEATGGHHMNLVISGALGIDYDEAERFKVDPAHADVVFGLVRPTLEKMATIAARAIAGHEVAEVHLVGGSAGFPQAPGVFSDVLGRDVTRPAEPLFATPLGTAMRRNHD